MTPATEQFCQAPCATGLIPPTAIEPDGKCRPAPIPDKDAMREALAAMFDPEDVIELRAFHKGKKRTDAGYFDGEHRQDLVDVAARLNSSGAAVYVTLNQIDTQLLGRYCNRVQENAAATATDANVTRRRWLLIDLDPVRPKDTSASDAQLEAAHERARACAKLLKDEGWPDPIAGQSGNGWHLLYPLDLPNDPESRDLVKGALAGLAAKMDNDVVTVDQAVFNAGRITKLYGTVATKGDHTPLAPWRVSRLVSTPMRSTVVTPEQLRALHPVKIPEPPPRATAGTGPRRTFDLSGFLSRMGIDYEHDLHEGADRYKLDHCPFNPEHGKGEAAIFQRSTGALGFKCQHNSCADKTWQDVRTLIDGPKEARHRRQADAVAPAMAQQQPGTGAAPAGDSANRKPDDATIDRLAALSPLNYDRVRKNEAKALGVRPGTLDKMVAEARKQEVDDGMDFVDVEPWQDPIEPAALLTEISVTVRRFIICQPETANTVALWVAMTWFMDVVQIAPLAVITAPEKRCGKSLLLFLLGKLAHRPLTASSISPAAMFRAVDAWRPTLLVDEADSFMRDNEELRGIVNAGHTRDSAYVVRTVGDNFTPTKFSVWGAKALAGIGHLADTLMDRAVVLELRRKLPHENVARLRHAEPDLFEVLAEKLARFADDYREGIRKARPDLPASLNDRAQDNWEPLLAIADIAGGEWPALGRRAALKLSGSDIPTMSTGTELLADIKEVFELKKADRISTADLIAALCDEDERPWATYNRGKAISPRQVSKRLADYGIKSSTIRIGTGTPKGFLREWFEEAFSRYLALSTATSATPPQTNNDAALRVADNPQRFGNETQSATPKPAPILACGGVADKRGATQEKRIVEVEI